MEGSRAGADADKAPTSRPPRREEDTVNLFRNYELRTAFAPAERRRLPTTLVTGWLGSGKTTVMRHVLANRQDLRVACVVNDFAELNIDADVTPSEVPPNCVPIVGAYHFATLHFTGSDVHNMALRKRAIELGMKLSEYSLVTAGGGEGGEPC